MKHKQFIPTYEKFAINEANKFNRTQMEFDSKDSNLFRTIFGNGLITESQSDNLIECENSIDGLVTFINENVSEKKTLKSNIKSYLISESNIENLKSAVENYNNYKYKNTVNGIKSPLKVFEGFKDLKVSGELLKLVNESVEIFNDKDLKTFFKSYSIFESEFESYELDPADEIKIDEAKPEMELTPEQEKELVDMMAKIVKSEVKEGSEIIEEAFGFEKLPDWAKKAILYGVMTPIMIGKIASMAGVDKAVVKDVVDQTKTEIQMDGGDDENKGLKDKKTVDLEVKTTKGEPVKKGEAGEEKKVSSAPNVGGSSEPMKGYTGLTKGVNFDKHGYPDFSKSDTKNPNVAKFLDKINDEVAKGQKQVADDNMEGLEKWEDKGVIVKYINGIPYEVGKFTPTEPDVEQVDKTDVTVKVKVPIVKDSKADYSTKQISMSEAVKAGFNGTDDYIKHLKTQGWESETGKTMVKKYEIKNINLNDFPSEYEKYDGKISLTNAEQDKEFKDDLAKGNFKEFKEMLKK